MMAGLAKLRNRQYHRPPLSKLVRDDLFELRHVGKLNTRVLYFFTRGQRIIAVHGMRNKATEIPKRDLTVAFGKKKGLVIEESIMKQKTNFDFYLEKQLKDRDFAKRFKKAGEAWDVAIKLASLRKASGLSQKELAKRVGTSQQQISRLESPSYEGHSLSMLRRVAEVLGAAVHVEIQPKKSQKLSIVADRRALYRAKKRKTL